MDTGFEKLLLLMYNRDELEDCLRYKSFLDMLTPTEWFEQHQQRHQEKVDKIKQDSFRAKHKEWDRLRRKLIEGEWDDYNGLDGIGDDDDDDRW